MPSGRLRRIAVPVGLAAVLFAVVFASPASAQDPDTGSPSAAPVDLCAVLAVTIQFEQEDYAGGDTATLSITVTNNGADQLQGLTTGSSGGQPNELVWDSSTWGELNGIDDAPGMSIGAGETKNVTGTGLVPVTAADYGRVFVLAPFVLKDGSSTCNPAFTATAFVPGSVGNLTGKAVDARNGAGVPGAIVAVYAIDHDSQCTAVTISGADGTFTFVDLPVGAYVAAYVPPPGWRGTNGYSEDANVGAGNRPLTFEVEPGESNIPYEPPAGCEDVAPPTTTPPPNTPAPKDPAPTAPGAPAPQGSAAPTELANTGGAPTGLIPIGLGLVLAGAVAALAARRIRTG